MATIATGSVENTVSNWAAPVVGGLVGAAVDTAGQDYQVYGGNKVADASDLQSNAFTGINSLATPTAVTNATTDLQNIYTKANTQPAYSGAQIGNQFTPTTAYQPTTQGNQFGGVTDYTPTQFTSGFNAPQAYTGATFNAGTVSAGLGAPGSVESYMNPYLQNVVDVQAREARRQADIQRAADARKFQGAFGGGRQALYQSEGIRNLNQQIGDIQAKGSQAAYDAALKQRLAEAEQYRLGQESTAKLGLEAQKEAEASRQFGAKQGLASSELAAKYGLDAQREAEASRQFAAKQGLTEAELQAKYGQAAADAAEASRQFAAKQGLSNAELAAKYGLEGLKASEESRQFGANLGLKYLTEAGQAAANMGQIGVNQGNFDLNRLKTMADMGATKRAIDQEGLTSDYADWVAQRDWDKTQQRYLKEILSTLPMTTQNQYAEKPTTAESIISGGLTADAIYQKLYGKKP
ncbi:MAG: hypothetical protein EBR47_12995 [Betaproteobacteria bacterium]|nr:hypothetical protein [Betaproteobacteria bacterium]